MSQKQFWTNKTSDQVSNWRDKKQTFQKTKSSDQKNKDKTYSSSRNKSYSKPNYNYTSSQQHSAREKQPKKENSFTDEDFPELISNSSKLPETTIQYLEECKKKKEEEDLEKGDKINTNDPQYWNGYKWIGPMFIKSNYCVDQNKQQSLSASAIVKPHFGILYSRDNHTWHNSWKNTFTDDEWENMEYQNNAEITYEVMEHLATTYEKELDEAYELYYDTGYMNICLQVHLRGLEYEKYSEKCDKEYYASQEEEDMENDSYDDDYLSDGTY